MTLEDFSNQFDVLYNNLAVSAGPGLNQYEKSVFLNKAQEQIVKNYFLAQNNLKQQGFDDNAKRRSDFSSLIRTTFTNAEISLNNITLFDDRSLYFKYSTDIFLVLNEWLLLKKSTTITTKTYKYVAYPNLEEVYKALGVIAEAEFLAQSNITDYKQYTNEMKQAHAKITNALATFVPFESITIANNYIDKNSKVQITERGGITTYYYRIVSTKSETNDITDKRLTVLPISYNDYVNLSIKPSVRPHVRTCWRLQNSLNDTDGVEILPPYDTSDFTAVLDTRFVKKPATIRLRFMEDALGSDCTYPNGSTIATYKDSDGSTKTYNDDEYTAFNPQNCELPEHLHEEILQRAVELAKQTMLGNLETEITTGARSE